MKILLEPTNEMVEAGIEEFASELPGVVDEMYEYFDADDQLLTEKLSDVVTFIWQAMASKYKEEE